MTPQRLLSTAIVPALAELQNYTIADNADARRLLLTIALQESGLSHRRQVLAGGLENGPAASFWQFEQGGGCKGVLTHPQTSGRMRSICVDFNIEPTPQALWEAMRYQDIVAAAAARLLVYTLPSKLATTPSDGWAQYTAAWRPGKPRPETWGVNWQIATTATGAA